MFFEGHMSLQAIIRILSQPLFVILLSVPALDPTRPKVLPRRLKKYCFIEFAHFLSSIYLAPGPAKTRVP